MKLYNKYKEIESESSSDDSSDFEDTEQIKLKLWYPFLKFTSLTNFSSKVANLFQGKLMKKRFTNYKPDKLTKLTETEELKGENSSDEDEDSSSVHSTGADSTEEKIHN